jgi:hypothetical protein
MSSLRWAVGTFLVLAASAGLSACDTDDGRTLRDPPPGATAPPMPTSSTTTAVPAPPPVGSEAGATIAVTSAAFVDGAAIPTRHAACDGGDDVSPAIAWTGVPASAVELAVVVLDEDTPGEPFVHWLLTGIDPSVTGFGEGGVPEGAVEVQPWDGPCPPEGETHDYVFTVYALGSESGVTVDAESATARAAVEATAIATGVLTGTYGRPAG